MAIIAGIDYGDLIVYRRHELDKLAYAKYYDTHFPNCLSFNQWYGSEEHKKYITPLVLPHIRKKKLEKINKAET